jgi:hypothetical protein
MRVSGVALLSHMTPSSSERNLVVPPILLATYWSSDGPLGKPALLPPPSKLPERSSHPVNNAPMPFM